MELVGRHLSEKVHLKIRTTVQMNTPNYLIGRCCNATLMVYVVPFYKYRSPILPEFLKKYHPMFKN